MYQKALDCRDEDVAGLSYQTSFGSWRLVGIEEVQKVCSPLSADPNIVRLLLLFYLSNPLADVGKTSRLDRVEPVGVKRLCL